MCMLDTFKYEFGRQQKHIRYGSSALSKIQRNWCALLIKDNRQCCSLFAEKPISSSLLLLFVRLSVFVFLLFGFLNWQQFVSAQLHSHSIYFIFHTPISTSNDTFRTITQTYVVTVFKMNECHLQWNSSLVFRCVESFCKHFVRQQYFLCKFN